MNIYIASPLFHKWEQRNVKYIEKWLKIIFRDATIYCPQDFQVPNAWELSNHVWAKKIFEEDHKQLDAADLVVCISYGYKSDDGAAWETGYAKAKGKEVWLVTADNDIGPYSLMFMTADKMFALDENYDVREIEPQDIEWK